MIVRIRLEIDDEQRRAIRARCGQPGLATRDEVTALVDMMLSADLEDACYELRTGRAAGLGIGIPPKVDPASLLSPTMHPLTDIRDICSKKDK